MIITMEDDNANDDYSKAIVPYDGEINNCKLHTVFAVECIKAKVLLEKKLRKKNEHQKRVCDFIGNNISHLELEIKLDKQKKESMLASLESNESRIVELKTQLLLAKKRRQNRLQEANNTVKKFEEQWEACQIRFKSIPFIKKYFDINDKIEVLKGNISALDLEAKKIGTKINLKKTELWHLEIKNIVELADYMINKRPVILKLIYEKTNKMIRSKSNAKEIKELVFKNSLPASPPTKQMIEAKNTSVYVTENMAQETYELPKLRLQNMGSVPKKFDQKVNYKSTAPFKRPVESFNSTVKIDAKKTKLSETSDEVTTYFTSSPKTYQTKKYSHRKLIHIIDDFKLDTVGTYNIISNINPYQLHEVNLINAGVSQKLKGIEPKDKVKEREAERIEEIKLTKKVSQDIILPPTQYVDLTQVREQETEGIDEINLTEKVSQDIILPPTRYIDPTQRSQEKRVTFSSVIQIEELNNLVPDSDHTRSEEDDHVVNNTSNSQLNASNDSYEKIKDFVFKKHNLDLSPEFTYIKKTVVPMVSDEVTSKFFNEKLKGDVNIGNANKQMELVKIVDADHNKPESDIIEIDAEKTNVANITSDTLFEDQEFLHKVDAPSTHLTFRNIQGIPEPLNISMNTTGYEDTDTEFPQCIDASLLLSPKADDEMPTSDNKVEITSQHVPNFLSGLKKAGVSFFGSTSSDYKPESDVQNQSENFNFTFGGEKKRGGLFSMFR